MSKKIFDFFSSSVTIEYMSEIFKNSQTFRLFRKEPSFIDGMASLVDFSQNIDRYNISKTPQGADIESLQADWVAVCADLTNSIKVYEQTSA